MHPKFIVAALYWLLSAWVVYIGMKSKDGEIRTNAGHIITVIPSSREKNRSAYLELYTRFHMQVGILTALMGALCVLIGRLLPVIIMSLLFFGFLNLFKFRTEEKLREIIGGGKVAK